MQYNTKNKKTIIEFFKSHSDEWFTAEQVETSLNSVGKSSVYRIVGELADSGVLLREYSERLSCAVYKIDNKNCREHFHLKCVECGRFVHIEDENVCNLLDKIAKNNDFSIDKGKSVLYGTCENCRKEERL